MDRQTFVLGAVLAVGAMVYVFVAVYVWCHRRAVGARALTVLLLAACVWTLCYLVELNVEGRSAVSFWGSVKYVGIVLLPPGLLAFALQYSGRRAALGRRTVALLLIEPAVVLAALTLPATRELVRSLPASGAAGGPLVAEAGPLFWVHLVYSYLMLVTGLGLLTGALLRVSRRYAWQAGLLIGSAVLPFALNAAFNLRLPGFRSYDLTPVGFSITSFVLVWGFFRFRLLDLLPVGRRLVVDRLPDAVLVLDAHGRVADSNPAASALVGLPTHDMIGRPLLELLPSVSPLAQGTTGTVTGSCRMVPQGASEAVDLSVTFSPLPDDVATPSGRLVVLRDVTSQRDVERRLRELVQERTDTIAILQRGLYPTAMPTIPGVDVAAVLDPAEAETNVGGDFVAVRASGPDRWSLMVGDVVGKGAGAATLTAVARHTTLALSSLGWAPSRVLADVSAAIALEDDGSDVPRFCTMALATLEPEPGGARVVLSLGGHPRPLLRRSGGDVTEVGVPGNLLGVLPDPDLYDSPLQLGPGDALVMFSDGVTEARAHDEDFGDRQLAELVSTLRHATAAEIVTAVVDAVREFRAGGPRDDVAVLAIVIPRRER